MSDNELIAEFMGAIINKEEYGGSGAMNRNWSISHPITKNRMILYGVEMLYDSSWDWLIPVAQKIKHLTYKDLKSQELPTFQQAVARWHAVQNEISNLKIEAAHYCIVHWIKWFNEKPK